MAAVAVDLGDLVMRVVFIGGAIAPLLQTDPPFPRARVTSDVDGVVARSTYAEEVAAAPATMRGYVAGHAKNFLADMNAEDLLAAHLNNAQDPAATTAAGAGHDRTAEWRLSAAYEWHQSDGGRSIGLPRASGEGRRRRPPKRQRPRR